MQTLVINHEPVHGDDAVRRCWEIDKQLADAGREAVLIIGLGYTITGQVKITRPDRAVLFLGDMERLPEYDDVVILIPQGFKAGIEGNFKRNIAYLTGDYLLHGTGQTGSIASPMRPVSIVSADTLAQVLAITKQGIASSLGDEFRRNGFRASAMA